MEWTPDEEAALALIRRLADGSVQTYGDLPLDERVERHCAQWDVPLIHEKNGVRLEAPLELLQRERITARLDPALALEELRLYADTDSTNARLLERAARGAVRAAALAEYQSAGRGRAARSWYSPFGRNLYLSVLWPLPDAAAAARGLAPALGVCVVRALEGLGFAGVGLKWPNDLLSDRGKLGGLLLEGRSGGGGAFAVVAGLGLNLSMPSARALPIDQRWADLSMLPGAPAPCRNDLAAAMIEALCRGCEHFSREGLAPFRDDRARLDRLRGREVEVRGGATALRGQALGIDTDGALLVARQGSIHRITVGDVSVRTTI